MENSQHSNQNRFDSGEILEKSSRIDTSSNNFF